MKRFAGHAQPLRCSRQRKNSGASRRQEVAREVEQLPARHLQRPAQDEASGLGATEMAVRSAMHHAGGVALTELLQFAAPASGQRTLPCSCDHQASYRDLRSKPVLSTVGQVKVSRFYYLCSHCHSG